MFTKKAKRTNCINCKEKLTKETLIVSLGSRSSRCRICTNKDTKKRRIKKAKLLNKMRW